MATFWVFVMVLLSLICMPINSYCQDAQASDKELGHSPTMNDSDSKVQEISGGLNRPTTMAILDSNDILVLEKNNGTVRRILNGEMLKEPLLDLHVANDRSRGLLGIDITTDSIIGKTFVFLYYTESSTATDNNSDVDPLGNRLYRFEFTNNKLTNPALLLDLPAKQGPGQNGGIVKVGPDNSVYVSVGDLMFPRTLMSNNKTGLQPDGTAGILRVTQDGKIVKDNQNNNGLLGDTHPLNMYYAYGIRNSFGMDFDPVTGNLWDTENGPDYGDEINLVEPGFNSGYELAKGKTTDDFDYDELVNFGGKGTYSEPEFSWGTEEQKFIVAPTALKFLNSNKLGEEYENDMFVGASSGEIYHFDLSSDRNDLELEGALRDKVAEDPEAEEVKNLILADGFGLISDLEVGPDGYLYVISHTRGLVYRISP